MVTVHFNRLFSGIKSGSAKVSVRLDSKATYATAVPATEVSVLVVANLYLVPQVAYVIFGGTVNYHAEQIKANKVFVHYFLSNSIHFLSQNFCCELTLTRHLEKACLKVGSKFGRFPFILVNNCATELLTDWFPRKNVR